MNGTVSWTVAPLLTFFSTTYSKFLLYLLQLLAMDVSAWISMKDAANCDKRCEWQNSANQKNAERILRFQATPESMSRSGRSHTNATFAFLCASDVKSVGA